MKHQFRSYAFLSFLCFSMCLAAHKKTKNVDVYFTPDTVSLIRNPAMGWVIYDDAAGNVAEADRYWREMDSIPEHYASIFYWRSRWSELEPEEGKYAWIYDENFKKIIQGALDRGLRLAFRFYPNSRDNIRQATPDYVRKAGAKGYDEQWWTPYPDDPIFQEKFEKFVKAFAQEFDDPDRVDFVDAYTLGWWGEGHSLRYLDEKNAIATYQWQVETFSKAFKNVILLDNLSANLPKETQVEVGIRKNGLGWRRDGLGSMYYRKHEREVAEDTFPEAVFIGESCYWKGGDCDVNQSWDADETYEFKTWVDVYKQTYKDAMESHANTLDLRQKIEAHSWTSRAKDLVESFKVRGGYRFTPVHVSFPSHAKGAFEVAHEWQNDGVGVCPNNNKRWNYKYRVAFALLDADGHVVRCHVDHNTDPSKWMMGTNTSYTTKIDFNVPKGHYTLALAIVDTTRENMPGIHLAADNANYSNNWLQLGNIYIK